MLKKIFSSEIFWLVIAMSASFIYGISHTKAATVFDSLIAQTDNSVECTWTLGANPCSISYQSQGIQYIGTGLSGTATSVSVYYNHAGNAPSLTITQCDDAPPYPNYPNSCTGIVDTYIGTDYTGTGSYWRNYSANYTFDPSKYYYLKPAWNTNDPNSGIFGNLGATPTGWNSDFYWRDQNYGNVYTYYTLSYIIGGNVTGGSIPPTILDLHMPTSSSTAYWIVDATFPTSKSGFLYIGLQPHSNYSTGYINAGTFFSNSIPFTFPTSSIATQISIPNTFSLDPAVTYDAQAILEAADLSGNIATSSQITFTPSIIGLQPPTASSTAINISCDEQSGAFATSLCYLFKYTLMPSQSSLDNFVTLKNDLKNKPPFGYIPMLSTALNKIDVATTSAYFLPDVSGIDFFVKCKMIIETILYLAFGFWLLKRIAQLEL